MNAEREMLRSFFEDEFIDHNHAFTVWLQAKEREGWYSDPDKFRERARTYFLFRQDKRSGWISRRGVFYRCNYAGHDAMLGLMGVPYEDAESSGWVHMSWDDRRWANLWCNHRPTDAQKRAMIKAGAWDEFNERYVIDTMTMLPETAPKFPQYEKLVKFEENYLASLPA